MKQVMLERMVFRKLLPSIGVLIVFFLFSGWGMAERTVQTDVHYTEQSELAAVKRDLDQIDAYASAGDYHEASVIVGRAIKARDIYRNYLERAAGISQELLIVRTKMQAQEQTISLQQLGALVQRLSLENLKFKDTFEHGEENFQTYQLIEKAIVNLEDAIAYWRISNHYRRVYRGSKQEKVEDDEILQTKILTAMNTIDELKSIMETREVLSKDLEED